MEIYILSGGEHIIATNLTEIEVMAVMNQLAEKFAKRDIKDILSLFAPDSDVILYAPEVDGRFVGLEGIRLMLERDWSQTKALSFEYQ